MDEIKKVSLIGLGAIGSFFAPRLYNWLDKGNFRVIADGERKERLETRGLTVNDINYKFPVITPDYDKDTSDLITLPELDLVSFRNAYSDIPVRQ